MASITILKITYFRHNGSIALDGTHLAFFFSENKMFIRKLATLREVMTE